MKKTLLMAAAALAAGIITSQAQPVYSQNIVGYVNQTFVAGYVNVANPLDNGGGNSLTNIIPNVGGALDGVAIYIWTGTGYTIDQLDSLSATGVSDLGNAPVPAPIINPGQMIFVGNSTGVQLTNTYTGTVHVDTAATGTNTIGSTTNLLAVGYNFVASKISVGGRISSDLQLTNPGGVLDGVAIYVPNINGVGAFLGYNIVQFDSQSGTGFSDLANAPVAEPSIPVASGVIIANNTGAPYTWVQSF
jgi:hypothetical protein